MNNVDVDVLDGRDRLTDRQSGGLESEQPQLRRPTCQSMSFSSDWPGSRHDEDGKTGLKARGGVGAKATDE
ncbi:unnamed protein product [Protopolystoma xenopodis]|uniref:Uncharacterized protein n=1 Tax=Protopolystoma xenopodis TaxID=117903 RepID=A0A3S5AZ55_9PLAT|nr:unnamed protein product [Protopolystoma xenopodis]